MLELVDKYFRDSPYRMKIYIPIYVSLWSFVALPHFSHTIRAILPNYVQTLYIAGRQVDEGLATDRNLTNYLVEQAILDKKRIQDELNRFTAIRKKRRLTLSEEKQEENLVQQMRDVEQRLQYLKNIRTNGSEGQPVSAQSSPSADQTSTVVSQSLPVTTPTVSTDLGTKTVDASGGRAPVESTPSGTSYFPQPSPTPTPVTANDLQVRLSEIIVHKDGGAGHWSFEILIDGQVVNNLSTQVYDDSRDKNRVFVNRTIGTTVHSSRSFVFKVIGRGLDEGHIAEGTTIIYFSSFNSSNTLKQTLPVTVPGKNKEGDFEFVLTFVKP